MDDSLTVRRFRFFKISLPGGTMSGGSPTERSEYERDAFEPQPYLTTHRAQAACTRELARLMDDVIARVNALRSGGIEDKPVVRQAPDRCIVQLGPVALTIGWLRGAMESIADGELLVIVWRGMVGPPSHFTPERAHAGPGLHAATSLWEQVLLPAGQSEAEWNWRSAKSDCEQCSSAELAERCVEQLRLAHQRVAAAH